MRKPIIVIFVTILIDMLGFGIIIPILPIFTKELGAENYQVGLIAMSFPIMNFFFAPFWGSLSDRFGRRPIILLSVLITGFSYLLFSQTTNLWLLLLSRTLSGIGSANLSVAQAYISDITPPSERTKTMGMIGAAFGSGLVVGPVLGGYLKSVSTGSSVDLIGYFTAGLCLINLSIAYLFLPESLKEKLKDVRLNFKVISGIITELRKPVIRELLLINFIFIASFMLMQMCLSLFWKEKIGMSETAIGNMFAFVGVTTVIVQGGLVGKMVKNLGEKRMLIYGAYLFIISLLLIPWVPLQLFLPIELFAIAIMSLANGCISPSIPSLISKSAQPSEMGQTLGVNQSVGALARAVGMAASGFVYGVDFHLPFMLAALLMTICIGLGKKVSG